MNTENSLTFLVPGKPVPYVRTTQRAKYVSKQYKRYVEYGELVRMCYLKAISELRLKSSVTPEEMGTISSRESRMPYKELPMKMIVNAEKEPLNFVRVTIYNL